MTNEDKLTRIERMVDDIHERLFVGNGKPSLTTLLDRHDQQLAALRWALGVVIVAMISVVAKLWVANN
jgi:hypothetical protein